jgi:large repetitive protein
MANFTINISGPANQPPTIGDGERSTSYGTMVVFKRADFTTNTTPPYSDPEGDAPLNLKVTSLPAGGTLKLDGIDVTINQEIPFSDIDLNKLTYTPDNANTAAHDVTFGFEISDTGSATYVS